MIGLGIRTAIILAAGLGTRMRPLTDDRPKPMVQVGEKVLIDWVLDDLAASEIETAIVNLHYKATVLSDHLAHRGKPSIVLSDEAEKLLDTGGGVAAALPLFDDDVFLITNSDSLWRVGLGPAVEALMAAWSDDMDALLLFAGMNQAFGFDGSGDFYLSDDGTPARRGDRASAPMAYAGTQLVHRRLFDNCPYGAFSFNVLWDQTLQHGTLKALLHNDAWYHVGTPDAVAPTAHALNNTVRSS